MRGWLGGSVASGVKRNRHRSLKYLLEFHPPPVFSAWAEAGRLPRWDIAKAPMFSPSPGPRIEWVRGILESGERIHKNEGKW